MAFVVVLFRGDELTRRELTGPLIVGRAPECDVSVRDILLSRRHCQFLPVDAGNWVVEDLGSKNGTRIKGEVVIRAALRDGASIRMGKTQVKFYVGAFRAGTSTRRTDDVSDDGASRKRPADPFEALSGTVEAFEYKPERPERDLSRLPSPRPKPSDAASHSTDDLSSMLTEPASSPSDSIYAPASGSAAVRGNGQQPSPKRRTPATAAATGPAADPPTHGQQAAADPSWQVFFPEPLPELEPPTAPQREQPASAAPPRSRWLSPMSTFLRGMRSVLTGKRFVRRAS